VPRSAPPRSAGPGSCPGRQQHALAEAGYIRAFADKLPGKTSDRPELAACRDYLRPGDTLVVASLDRLSCSLADLILIVGALRRHGVGFNSLHEARDTTPGGRPVFYVFAALAEFIRGLIGYGPGKLWCPDVLISVCYLRGSAQRSHVGTSSVFHVVSLRASPSHLSRLGPPHRPLLWSHALLRKRPSP